MRTRLVRHFWNQLNGNAKKRATRLALTLLLILGQPLSMAVEVAHLPTQDALTAAASLATPGDGELDAGHGTLDHELTCHHGSACSVFAILSSNGLATLVRSEGDAVIAESAVLAHNEEPNTPPPIA